MSYTDSPEYITSKLRSEISSSEYKTNSRISEAESRLNTRIHELKMELIESGAFRKCDCLRDCWMPVLMALPFVVILILCLVGRSRESEHTAQATHSQMSAPQNTPTQEDGK